VRKEGVCVILCEILCVCVLLVVVKVEFVRKLGKEMLEKCVGDGMCEEV
jgi:hypothetical protein